MAKNQRTRLTKQQETFVHEYVRNGGNASAAYKVAYPKCAKWSGSAIRVEASRTLALPNISLAVDELRKRMTEKMDLTTERVLQEAAYIGLADPLDIFAEGDQIKPVHEWPERIRRAVASIKIKPEMRNTPEGQEFLGYSTEVRFWDKNSAIEKLMKHFGMFEKDNEQKNPFRDLPRTQLKELEQFIGELVAEHSGKAPADDAGATARITH